MLGLNELSVVNFDTVVVLAWQHSRVLMQRINDVKFGGVTVCIMPRFDLIEPTYISGEPI